MSQQARTIQAQLTSSGAGATAANALVMPIGFRAGTISVQVDGGWIGTLQFEAAADPFGATFYNILMLPSNSATTASSTTANGLWTVSCAGLFAFRVRASALSEIGPTVHITVSPNAQ